MRPRLPLLVLALASGSAATACGGEGSLPRDPLPEPAPTQPDPTGPVDPNALPGDATFLDGQLLDVQLTLDPAVYQDLEEHGDREEYVATAASLQLSGRAATALANIGVRHKGAYSLHHCWDEFGGVRSRIGECAKLSFKLKFDEYERATRFDGLKRLNLHASSSDTSMLHELIAYRTFRDFGVDAPRAIPARVSVNGTVLGLFIAVEDVDGRYTTAHFPDAPNGNLYKEVWPNPATPDTEFLAALETNEELGNVDDIRAFAFAMNDPDVARQAAALEGFVDVDNVLRYIAVDRALRNWDGIMAFYSPRSPHNFFWYHDGAANPRFHLIPWDLDAAFWAFDPYMDPQQWVTAPPVPNFNARPLSCEPRPIWEANGPEHVTPPRCDRMLNALAEQHWPRLVQLGQELLAGPFSSARLQELASAWLPVIEPVVAQDPTLDPVVFHSGVNAFLEVVAGAGPAFQAFLDEGLIDERPVSDPNVEPPPPGIDEPTGDDGLHIDTPTNFEFGAPPASGEPTGVFMYGDPLATFSSSWSTDAPISGAADLRFDFTFNRSPGTYDEWVGIGIAGVESDVRAYSGIVAWLSADTQRQVRVRLESPAYEEAFGGVLGEFGVDVSVGPEPRAVSIDFDAVYYPAWAKESWTEGQGFPGTDQQALEQVLQRFGSIVFGPSATMDATGQLSQETETGFLRIDNIYFR